MASRSFGILLRHIRHLAGDPTPDHQLLERFVSRKEEAAFEALIERHGPAVLRVCQRVLHDHHAAEDAFQATFLVLVRKGGSIGKRERLGNWLYGVASRVARRAKVEAAKRHDRETKAKSPRPDATSSEVDHRELDAVLDKELERLPERYRAPFLLCFVEGQTRDQAALKLGWPLRTLQRRLEQGRDLLKARLTRRGVTLSAAMLAVELGQRTAVALSPSLVTSTLETAALFVAGQSASTSVVALAEGVLQAMTTTKLKVVTMLVLAFGIVATGAGVIARQTIAEQPLQAKQVATSKADQPKQEGAKETRTDRYVDPLPPGTLLRLGSVRFRGDGQIGSVSFSPDGKLLATGEYGGVLRLWNTANGKEIRKIETKTYRTPSVAFSPDGKILASTGYKTLQLWDVISGKELRKFEAELAENKRFGGEHIIPVAFSPDGQSLASVAPDQSVLTWETKTGKELLKLTGHANDVCCLRFSPDGKRLLSASGNGVDGGAFFAWDLASGKEVLKQPLGDGKTSQMLPLAISPDGESVASHVHHPQKVQLIDVNTGRVLQSLECKAERLRGAVFSSDGKTVVTLSGKNKVTRSGMGSDQENRIKVWDVASGSLRFDFNGYNYSHDLQSLAGLALSDDGKTLASIGSGSAVHLWDITTSRELLDKPETHHDGVRCVAFSPDGSIIASSSEDHTIALWDATTGRFLRRMTGLDGGASTIVFSPDGKLLASAGSNYEQTVRLWDLATGKQLHTFVIPSVSEGNGMSISVGTWIGFASGGNILVSVGSDRKVRRWEVATGKELLNATLNRGSVEVIPYIKSGGPDWYKHWIYFAAFRQDGDSVIVATKNIHVVDVSSGQVLHIFVAKPDTVRPLSASSDGKMIAWLDLAQSEMKNRKILYLIEAVTGKELLAIGPLHDQQTIAYSRDYRAIFSPDGRTIAVAGGPERPTITLFDMRTGKQLLQYPGHGSAVNSLAFSPDGKNLVTGHADTTVLVWDLAPARPEPLPSRNLNAKELEELWDELKGEDASKVHAAIWSLAASPDKAVGFLKDRLRPVPKVPAERLRQLVANLDSAEFTEREEATKLLKKLGMEAVPALQEALKDTPSLERKRRLEDLLKYPLPESEMTPDSLRHLRAIQALEQIGSPEARWILEALAAGAVAAPETRDAKATLERLARRR